MRRRQFITLLGGAAAAWPVAARAQRPALPVIGFLSAGAEGGNPRFVPAFRQGLSELDFVEGRNVALEFRWAEEHYDRLPELAADFVRRKTAMIAAFGPLAALAAKAATQATPVVFVSGADPVTSGIVSSLNRPGDNLTGISLLFNGMVAKQVQLLHDAQPRAASIGVLVNPSNVSVHADLNDAETAAKRLGLQVVVHQVTKDEEIERAFADFVEKKVSGVLVTSDFLLASRTKFIVALALRERLPTISNANGFAQAGGLMGYGTDILEGYRQAGIYAGKVLKGAKPSELPIFQLAKFRLLINTTTARVLGVTIPPTVLAIADEVIE
jgi:putative tryptophan/tyrosine transport system substrate-binding protein